MKQTLTTRQRKVVAEATHLHPIILMTYGPLHETGFDQIDLIKNGLIKETKQVTL